MSRRGSGIYAGLIGEGGPGPIAWYSIWTEIGAAGRGCVCCVDCGVWQIRGILDGRGVTEREKPRSTAGGKDVYPSTEADSFMETAE
jgi:hypothetical protein